MLIPLASVVALTISLPIAITLLADTKAILQLWLRVDVPEQAVVFAKFAVLTLTMSLASRGHGLAMNARGDIGWLVLGTQGIILAGVLIGGTIAVAFTGDAWQLLAGECVGAVLAFCVWQPFWVNRQLRTDWRDWRRYTIIPALAMVLACAAIVVLVGELESWGWVRIVVQTGLSGVVCMGIAWRWVLHAGERQVLAAYVTSRVKGP
jgi:hypothetical protein